ncbi:hypothetical protein Trydic_g1159 [Trypoxylus dichotomus]
MGVRALEEGKTSYRLVTDCRSNFNTLSSSYYITFIWIPIDIGTRRLLSSPELELVKLHWDENLWLDFLRNWDVSADLSHGNAFIQPGTDRTRHLTGLDKNSVRTPEGGQAMIKGGRGTVLSYVKPYSLYLAVPF